MDTQVTGPYAPPAKTWWWTWGIPLSCVVIGVVAAAGALLYGRLF